MHKRGTGRFALHFLAYGGSGDFRRPNVLRPSDIQGASEGGQAGGFAVGLEAERRLAAPGGAGRLAGAGERGAYGV